MPPGAGEAKLPDSRHQTPESRITWSSGSRLDPLDGLGPFVAVVDAGSFSAAARALGVPRETLSRQVAALEARLGVSLLHRTTRKLAPTVAGAELYTRAATIVGAAEAAVAAVRSVDGVPRGRLRISLPAGGNGAFTRLIGSFLAAWPEVELEVVATNRHVDLVAEGFDLALRAGTIRDPELVVRQLGRTSVMVVAAPTLLAARGAPLVPEDLAGFPCICGMGGGARPMAAWPLWAGGEVRVHGRFAADDVALLLDRALEGLGLALLPQLLVAPHLAAGRLVHVLPAVGAATSIGVVFPARGQRDPKVRAFVDHAVAFTADGGLIPEV